MSDSSDVYVVEKKGLGRTAMVFAAGTALFSDGYQNGVISDVNLFLGLLYPDEYADNNHGVIFASMAFAGTVVGMLTFGYISDKIGRKSGMMICSVIIFVFAALSSGAYGAGGSITGMLAALSAYRFLLGIGIGGEYPSGSVAAAENSAELPDKRQHMLFALATNCMIDFGFVISALVPLILVLIFGDDHLRAVWRISLGLGCVPAAAVFIWRLKMSETTSYTKYSMKKAKTPYLLIAKKYWKSFLAISFVWFVYDFISYPFGLYSATVVNTIIGMDAPLTVQLGWAVVINCFYLPGCIGGALLVDRVKPKRLIVIMLALQAIVGFIMSGLYTKLSEPSNIGGFAVIYGLFLAFGEAGPGNCIGLLASKTSPTPFRGQYYGMAAAVGKIGAFAGTWAFPALIADFPKGDPRAQTGPFYLGSGLAVLSALVALFFIVEVPASHMRRMDEEFMAYLEEHGYDTSQLGLHGEEGTIEHSLAPGTDVKTEKQPMAALDVKPVVEQ